LLNLILVSLIKSEGPRLNLACIRANWPNRYPFIRPQNFANEDTCIQQMSLATPCCCAW